MGLWREWGGSLFTTCSTLQWDAIVSPLFQQQKPIKYVQDFGGQICAGFWWPFLPLCACCNVQTAQNHSQFNNKNLPNMCRILVTMSASSLCLPLVSKLRKIILHRINSINLYLYNYGNLVYNAYCENVWKRSKKCQDYGNLVCNAYCENLWKRWKRCQACYKLNIEPQVGLGPMIGFSIRYNLTLPFYMLLLRAVCWSSYPVSYTHLTLPTKRIV